MLKVLLALYCTSYFCFVFYTREPDYFDGEHTTGIVSMAVNKTCTASYLVNNMPYVIEANYPLRSLQQGQKIDVIFNPAHPQQAAVYSLWGYWFTWGELLISMVLLFALYQLAVSITKNPTDAE